jgi:hypothetical protein
MSTAPEILPELGRPSQELSAFRRYDLYGGQPGRTLELYDTERARDVNANLDMIIPVPAKGSKGACERVRH